MNIQVKKGVEIKCINTQLITVCHVVYGLSRQGDGQVFLTSASDGLHGEGSYHPEGNAWDFDKLNDNFTRKEALCIKLTLKAISPFYDIVLEKEKDNHHLHIEWDRRRAEKHKNNRSTKAVQIQTKPLREGITMSNTFKAIIRIVASVIGPILRLVTARFREELIEWVQKEYGEALETENPWDDFLFETIAGMFKIPLNNQ